MPLTVIFPWVMVPVLSKQRVSTQARVSTEYISWTKTLRIPNLITAVKRVTVRRAIPFGNMPRRAVEEVITESFTGSSLIKKASQKGDSKWDNNLSSKTRDFCEIVEDARVDGFESFRLNHQFISIVIGPHTFDTSVDLATR